MVTSTTNAATTNLIETIRGIIPAVKEVTQLFKGSSSSTTTPPATQTDQAQINPLAYLQPGTGTPGTSPLYIEGGDPNSNQLQMLLQTVNGIPQQNQQLIMESLQPEFQAKGIGTAMQKEGLDGSFDNYLRLATMGGLSANGTPQPINLKELVAFQKAVQSVNKANKGSLLGQALEPVRASFVTQKAKEYLAGKYTPATQADIDRLGFGSQAEFYQAVISKVSELKTGQPIPPQPAPTQQTPMPVQTASANGSGATGGAAASTSAAGIGGPGPVAQPASKPTPQPAAPKPVPSPAPTQTRTEAREANPQPTSPPRPEVKPATTTRTTPKLVTGGNPFA